ncbi:sigma-54 interaction domain-containing protein [Novosphingobium mangrovi (ex Huang et al. 2023)]|uniref:Sigma 54-interacting transcriptional regulator n=1 Tax=Novosphingobium mangrovi (ex Huang et al. 2023) TaxID=2976432 RepID=A0ABT2I047_9SPHN|nr:sigma 54-interacting transcriptional regulator [Novosphingobium mangrovi (ex Huang et al. 2023)]MCT2398167.1 sigma 54-interacting transcriptional regulator [Novosphingobium mangrovi (ex Huang et al. 2023)]
MAALALNDEFARRHGALVNRARAIATSLFDCDAIDLRDATDTSPLRPNARTVRVARGQLAAIGRTGADQVDLTYGDAVSEASLAMLLAAMAGSAEPIAADPESLSIFALADRLASSDIPVLINGPTGTGKEVLSRFIHARSDRRNGPFIAVNCAAMPETMLEAMLFGHQKGAFTGATQASEGFMRAADGGTLLLDEIAEMPLQLQAKLLRALQEQEVVPIGSTHPIKIDVRIIACANRDLPAEVAEGRFRADLYYRLNVFPLTLRPLRERPDDIAPLAFAMAMRHAPDPARVPVLTEGALAMLKLHQWPGNVRELENVVRRALLLAHGKATIAPEDIVFDSPARLVAAPPATAMDVLDADAPRKLSSVVQISEARAIMETLEACGGNRGRTARELGISERTLRYRLASLREAGIEIGRTAVGGLR